MDSFSVADLTAYIRTVLESDPQLQSVWVSGEVSNLSKPSSGHWYFTLKDSQAQLRCVMWRSSTSLQSYTPQNGDSILAHGYLSIYDSRGEYQLYADRVRPLGVGDLYAQFERLKAKLEAEGVFAPERKRPLPLFPLSIGIVTSPEAAAFQDVQNILRRRFPLAQILLSPTQVQGDSAPPLIVAAIERLQDTPIDLMIVCRGGGSIEDLWAFNDERVARAIAASRVPVISGVGHETDFTIADFAADLRAPTPSAAAEIATPDIADLGAQVDQFTRILTRSMQDYLENARDDMNAKTQTLKRLSPLAQVRNLRQRVDDMNGRMVAAQRGKLSLLRERLATRAAKLTASDPSLLLSRGYAAVYRSEDGARITSSAQVKPGEGITIQLGDGELKARVEDKDTHDMYKRKLF